MVAHGYLVFLVRAGVSRHPEQLYRLSEIGQSGDDLLQLLHHHVGGLAHGYHHVERKAEGFRIKENALRGRTHWLKINRGPSGSPGETYDLDTDTSMETTERQALLSGLRAMFVVPLDSYYGLLFVERVGRRNLRDLLMDIAVRPSGSSAATVLRIEAFAEIQDWERELAQMQVLRISEILTKRDSGDDASTVEDTIIKVSAEGGTLRQISDGLKALFSGRIHRRDERLDTMQRTSELGERRRQAKADGVTFQDEAEFQETLHKLQELNVAEDRDDSLFEVVDQVLAIDREQLDHQRFEVALGAELPQRTIVIEGDSIPQFVYELGGRLTDGALRNTWVDHAESILSARGVDLPARWADNRPRGARRR